ncbi:MAG: electron transfer flavoprotein subunit beta/FixA family protein [Smithella sp.]
MKIAVCIKQVPGVAAVTINPKDNTLIREDIPSIINPFDMYAIEEGLLLRDHHKGKVTVISMGPPQAVNALREAIGMGADDAVLLTDPAFAGSDSWSTAYTLSLAIKTIGEFDIIVCGKQAIDGDTGQVGPELARQLNITQLTYVFKIRELDPLAGRIVVERLLEEGHEIVEAKLPVLLTVVKDINKPRFGSFSNLRRASKQKIRLMMADDLTGVDKTKLGLDGSPTRVMEIFSPPKREGVLNMIHADTIEQEATMLADKLIAEKIL